MDIRTLGAEDPRPVEGKPLLTAIPRCTIIGGRFNIALHYARRTAVSA